MTATTLGSIVYSFFLEYLRGQKGLRPTSIHSYRDALRLFLLFVATEARRPVSQLRLDELTFERVLGFLQYLEITRRNHVPTRNQRLAALRTFFEYVGRCAPERLHVCERVAAIPTKRTPAPETRFMDRDEIAALFARIPKEGRYALRDHALLLLLYNTGARVQEVADLRVEHLTLSRPLQVRLHGKGDKWRTCPLWDETARILQRLCDERQASDPRAPVFASATGRPLSRFGIYKRVRHHAARIEAMGSTSRSRRITPHVFRHYVEFRTMSSTVVVTASIRRSVPPGLHIVLAIPVAVEMASQGLSSRRTYRALRKPNLKPAWGSGPAMLVRLMCKVSRDAGTSGMTCIQHDDHTRMASGLC